MAEPAVAADSFGDRRRPPPGSGCRPGTGAVAEGEAGGVPTAVLGVGPEQIPEGTLWTALPHRHHVNAALVAEFKPTIRRRDLAIATAVLRGFTPTDEATDQVLLRHRTVA